MAAGGGGGGGKKMIPVTLSGSWREWTRGELGSEPGKFPGTAKGEEWGGVPSRWLYERTVEGWGGTIRGDQGGLRHRSRCGRVRDLSHVGDRGKEKDPPWEESMKGKEGRDGKSWGRKRGKRGKT